MDEMSVLDIMMIALRFFNIFISLVGILVGVDMLFGARALTWAGKFLNKNLAFDKALIKTMSSFKSVMDKEFSFEKTVFNTKVRFIFGILIIILAGILYHLAK